MHTLYIHTYIYTYMCIHRTQWSVQGGEAHVYLLLYQKYLLYLSSLFKVCLFFVCTLCREGGLRYICYYRFHSLSASTRRCLFFFQDLKRKLKVLLVEKENCEGLLLIWASLTHPPPPHAIGNWANFTNYVLWAISLDYSTESYSTNKESTLPPL